MGEGSDKPPMPHDAQRRVALARRLTSGNRVVGARSSGDSASGLKSVADAGAPSSPLPVASSSSLRASPPSQPSSIAGAPGPRTPGSERNAPSVRDVVLAARRDAIVDPRLPGAPRPAEEPDEEPAVAPSAPRKVRPAFLVLAGASFLVVLVALALWAKDALYRSSPQGRVHEALIDWEMAPGAEREAVFLRLDRLGPAVLPDVLNLLVTAEKAERGESHSSRTLREIAQLYLMHVAAAAKVPPPKVADELSKSLFAGSVPADAQWVEVREAWRVWVEEQRGKGTLPKP